MVSGTICGPHKRQLRRDGALSNLEALWLSARTGVLAVVAPALAAQWHPARTETPTLEGIT